MSEKFAAGPIPTADMTKRTEAIRAADAVRAAHPVGSVVVITAIDPETGGDKVHEVTVSGNPEGERFFRGEVVKKRKDTGILGRRFRHNEDKGRMASAETHLHHTDNTSPYVALTTDPDIARYFLDERMQQEGLKDGYIYEIIPKEYLDTRAIVSGQRDINDFLRHGMNKNKEVLVPGRVRHDEIHSTQKITRNDEFTPPKRKGRFSGIKRFFSRGGRK